MNVEEKLCEFWEARRSLQPNTRTFRPFHGWQRGAGKHLVFLFRVKAPEILKIIAEVQADLCGDEAFVPFPSEYLHITVKVWGFLEDKKDAADDILPKELERAIPHLRENVATVKAFETELGRVNVFPSVVFAEVKDGGGFAELNRNTGRRSQVVGPPELHSAPRDRHLPRRDGRGTFDEDVGNASEKRLRKNHSRQHRACDCALA